MISKIFENPQMTPELDAIFSNIKDDLKAPFVPNFFKVWGDAPESLAGIFPVMKHILASGKLDRKLKEMIMLAISSLKQCNYCAAAHQGFAKMMGVSDEAIATLKANSSLTTEGSEKDKAAIDFAVQLAENSNSNTSEKVDHLKSVGFNKEEILEIIAMSGMSVFYNHLADATKINIDDSFKS